MFANPQSRVLSTGLPLTLLFGTAPGIKLDILLHVAIALAATYALARHVGLAWPAAALAAAAYGLSGLAVWPVAFGMTWSLTIAYVPLAFLGYLASAERPRWAWLSAASLALILFGGGAYVVAITISLLVAHAAIDLAATRRRLRARRLAWILALFVGLSAIKLLPVYDFLREYPRRIEDEAGFSVVGMLRSLFDRTAGKGTDGVEPDNLPGFWRGTNYGFDENLMYVGAVTGLLFLVGAAARAKETWKLLACVFVFVWVAFGWRAPIGLWPKMHLLPVFDSMRVPERFRIAFLVPAVLVAGFGLQAVESWLARRRGLRFARAASVAVVAIVVVDVVAANSRGWGFAFPVPPPPIAPAGDFRETCVFPQYDRTGVLPETQIPFWRDGPATSLFLSVQQNVGNVNAYETADVPRNPTPWHAPEYR
ncbi:MAG TPA: hypothetical protein VKE69_08160, partial [Planctomycetota bacterium]|nr:hypothetical protein [Planctomycetota bacterium]